MIRRFRYWIADKFFGLSDSFRDLALRITPRHDPVPEWEDLEQAIWAITPTEPPLMGVDDGKILYPEWQTDDYEEKELKD